MKHCVSFPFFHHKLFSFSVWDHGGTSLSPPVPSIPPSGSVPSSLTRSLLPGGPCGVLFPLPTPTSIPAAIPAFVPATTALYSATTRSAAPGAATPLIQGLLPTGQGFFPARANFSSFLAIALCPAARLLLPSHSFHNFLESMDKPLGPVGRRGCSPSFDPCGVLVVEEPFQTRNASLLCGGTAPFTSSRSSTRAVTPRPL